MCFKKAKNDHYTQADIQVFNKINQHKVCFVFTISKTLEPFPDTVQIYLKAKAIRFLTAQFTFDSFYLLSIL